ncbi:MAG: TlpA family protein disulfide reductase [Anaerolineae bacterium]|nr:TlpA family protein disulfide reductase [Anaerolineae bacterium]
MTLAGLGVLLVVAAYAAYDSRERSPRVAAEVGALAPDVRLTGLEGQEMQLSQFRGRPLLLNFRTTWCGYCRQEAPELQAAHETLPELVVLGVYIDESAGQVSSYAQQLGLTFPVALDDGGESAQAYNVRGIPMSFFLDAGGVITAQHLGPLSLERIRSYLSEQG